MPFEIDMSITKSNHSFKTKSSQIIFAVTILFICFFQSNAQTSKVEIKIISFAPTPRVKVEGEITQERRRWSFRKSYAGVPKLAERIENLKLFSREGKALDVKKLSVSDYETETSASKFSYEVKLEPPFDTSDSAFVSWLTNERGLLLPGDLLPLMFSEEKMFAPVSIKYVLPDSWKMATVEDEKGRYEYKVGQVSRAVFVAGKDIRSYKESIKEMEFGFVAAGDWFFQDENAKNLAVQILNDHTSVYGGVPTNKSMLVFLPFPRQFGATRWSAETRGRTVVYLSGKMPSNLSALIQMSLPLAHELFHLWLPNGLALEGEYDWFYEGFTIYQSMHVGRRLNYLQFQDCLNSIARAYDAYKNDSLRDAFSLPMASKQRWAGANNLIYNKGMLTAFLYDLTLRQKSGNKLSIENIFAALFRLHNKNMQSKDGNTAMIELLSNYKDMKEFVTNYVENPVTIDLANALSLFGLVVSQENGQTKISVDKKLSRSKRDLLKKLGYNEDLFRVGKRQNSFKL